MAELRTIQGEKESGAWNNLPEQQREEKENSLQRTGRTARYMNIMGMKTVNSITLFLIFQYSTTLFCSLPFSL